VRIGVLIKKNEKKGSVQTFYLQASRGGFVLCAKLRSRSVQRLQTCNLQASHGGFVTCAKLRSSSVFWRCDAATPVDIQLGRPADGGAATGSGNSRQLVYDVCPFDV